MNFISKHKLVVKYSVTGLLASSIDLLLLFIFKAHFHFWYLTSAVMAFFVSFTFAFVVQKYWTFADYSDYDIHGQFIRYLFTVFATLFLILVILSSLVELTHLNYLLAQIVALAVAGVFGFVMNVRNVFSRPVNARGVLIAAGIFPPEIGGPASHISKLAHELTSRGVKVSVVTYAKLGRNNADDDFDVVRISSSLSTISRGFSYLVALFVAAVNYPNIFAQDITSTGLPAVIVKKVLPHKKLVIRIGGDLLWERECASGATKISMIDYYRFGNHKYKFLFKLGRFVMSSADQVVVPAEFLKTLYVKYYKIAPNKIVVVKNPVFVPPNQAGAHLGAELPSNEKQIIYAGRFIKLKNLDSLVAAFSSVYDEIKPARLMLVGEGPEEENLKFKIQNSKLSDRVAILHTLTQQELFSQISNSSLCVCPSWTDVNSNFILECLALGKPVLSTRNNGLSVKLPEEMLFSCDDEIDFRDKIKSLLADQISSAEAVQLSRLELAKNSWEDVISQYFKVFNL